MAFSTNLDGRMDELRYSSMRQPDVEVPLTANIPTSRDPSTYFSAMTMTNGNDVRSTLQRRFTTDSSKLSMARPFSQGYGGFNNASVKRDQIYEDIQDARRKAQEQLALLDMQERKLKLGGTTQDMDLLSNGFNRVSLNGPVSEPTTPPDYSEDVFSNRFSRSSRISASGITSPPGLTKRLSHSSSKITSPPSNRHSNQGYYSSHRHSTKSMPGSRRGSDEDEYYPEDLPAVRSAATFNRFSMPVNGSRGGHRFSMSTVQQPSNGHSAFDPSFLLEGDEDSHNNLTPIAQAYAQLGGGGGSGEEAFPTLTSNGSRLSANSAALDLANPKITENDWNIGSRPRAGHASMPHTDSSLYRPVLSNLSSPPERPAELPRRKSQRHSVGVTFDESSIPPVQTTRPASLQTSFSTNDVPTVKKIMNADSVVSPPRTQAESQFHAHNVSLGRIPANAVNNRQSRELSVSSAYRPDDLAVTPTLQASAAPFNGTITSPEQLSNAMSQGMSAYNTMAQAPVYPFTLQNLHTANGFANPNSAMINMVNGYNTINRPQDVQARGVGRRQQDETRFNTVPLESYQNNLYELCKDQHGCRYLQRKLEDGVPEHIEMIFQETCPHIRELMTDPFGNYLCQKLFEHCTDNQRSTLIQTAAPALAVIALNQHGTRALQKMIEFVHTDAQIDMIIHALGQRVVDLVQDLNGNHVIQKCLTRLGAERCQFIYDAVGSYSVVVGTHRHGCCVLQRCIDHSTGHQRAQLIQQITDNAFDLVQDPFGNYVVQYILDLDEKEFTRPLCLSFKGRVVALSRQKFSSNVIEKCLRTADMDTRKELIEEMLSGDHLEAMLRDSFANYVVQTAMDYADQPLKLRIIDMIRPILPSIKQTPHGRRIASKITSTPEYQGRVNAAPTAPVTSSDNFGPGFSSGRANRRQVQIVGGGFNRAGYTNTGFSTAEHQNGQMASTDGYYAMNGFSNGNNGQVQNGYAANPAQASYSGFQPQAENNYI